MEIAVPITIIMLANVINSLLTSSWFTAMAPYPPWVRCGLGDFCLPFVQVIGVIIVTWYLARKEVLSTTSAITVQP